MAGRIRTIKPELIEDDRTAGLSHEAFRLFVGMLLLADDYGNLRAHPAQLGGAVFWLARSSRDPRECLAELSRAGLVRLYSVRGQEYAALAGWSKHQRVDKPSKPRVPGPDDAQATESTDGDDDPRGTLARPSRDPRETLAPDHDHDHDPDPDPDTAPIGDVVPFVRPAVAPSADAAALAELLADAILSHKPDAVISGAKAWPREFDVGLRSGVTRARFEAAIDFAHRDPRGAFWRPNILSAKKLRQKLDTLEIQAARPVAGGPREAPGLTSAQLFQMAGLGRDGGNS